MEIVKRWSSVAVGLLLLVSMVCGVVLCLRYALSQIAALNPTVSAAMIAASATAIASVGAVVLGKRVEAVEATRKAHRDRTAPIYEELVKFLLSYFVKGSDSTETSTQDEFVKFMSRYTRQLMIWGSDDVIAAWARFRYKSMSFVPGVTEAGVVMDVFEDLIRAIRRDLGHSSRRLGG